MDDMRRAAAAAIASMGDAGVKAAFRFYLGGIPVGGRDSYLESLARRFAIAREWSLFFERHPVLLTAISWERQFPIDDDARSQQRMEEILAAQSPLLAVAMLGLPGLAVPTGMAGRLPTGVQLVAARFREDLLLRAGGIIEQAAGFSALDVLAR